MSVRTLIALLTTGAFVIGGCAPAGFGVTPTRPPASDYSNSTPTPSPQPAVSAQPAATRVPRQVPATLASANVGEAPAELVQQAIEDMVKRFKTDAAQIHVVSTEAVTWNDGSLGCPQPGMAYIQMLIEGYKIVLSYEGNLYNYHTNTSAAFLCEAAPITGPNTRPQLTPELKMINLAMTDLSQRLGTPTRQMESAPLEPRVWPDTSLGCPVAGQVYQPVQTKGYAIVLKVGDQSYTYHSDLQRVVYCESPQ